MYANMTKQEIEKATEVYNAWVQMDGIGVGQAVSIATKDAFGLSDRAWNGKKGANAFAATMAALVMNGTINISAAVAPEKSGI